MKTKSLVAISALLLILSSHVEAQRELFKGSDAPGLLAHKRLIAEPSIGGYPQPVSFHIPNNGEAAYWDGQAFSPFTPQQILLGLQLGPVYRMEVRSILRGQTITVYPTVEMLDRLYPPNGFANRHPVNIVFTESDLELAQAGNLVTKVVYIENPDTALPYRLTHQQQSLLEIGKGQDPYTVADRLGRPVAIIRLGSRHPIANEIQNMVAPIPVAAETNQLPPQTNGVCEQGCSCNVCETVFSCGLDEVLKLPQPRRDEYVCDGNDRNLQVVATDEWELEGLDTEDTVAHFDTIDGRIVVAPSNRVCIYSPRFASVRRVLSSNSTTIQQKLNVAQENTIAESANRAESTELAKQNLQLQANKSTIRPNAFIDRTRGVEMDNTIVLRGTRDFFKPFENLQLIRFGDFIESEGARITLGMQSALAWESDVSAQITINNSQPIIVRDVSQASEIVSIETDTSSELRLCKIASAISAQPGDLIDFTIRFDNIGRQRIGNVTIVDNLSPRLEFVTGSAECSLEAEFETASNDSGSDTLRWILLDPLGSGKGGLVRFKCRVR